jgi:hypothetical protein
MDAIDLVRLTPVSQPLSPGDDAPEGTPGTGDRICPRCGGSGEDEDEPCPECDGTGIVQSGIGGG